MLGPAQEFSSHAPTGRDITPPTAPMSGIPATGGYNTGATGGYNTGATGGHNTGAMGGQNTGAMSGHNTGAIGGQNTGAMSGHNIGGQAVNAPAPQPPMLGDMGTTGAFGVGGPAPPHAGGGPGAYSTSAPGAYGMGEPGAYGGGAQASQHAQAAPPMPHPQEPMHTEFGTIKVAKPVLDATQRAAMRLEE